MNIHDSRKLEHKDRTLTQNIRERRGEKVDIRMPIYKDINTPNGMEYIDMDCMAFGMGSSCLQVK